MSCDRRITSTGWLWLCSHPISTLKDSSLGSFSTLGIFLNTGISDWAEQTNCPALFVQISLCISAVTQSSAVLLLWIMNGPIHLYCCGEQGSYLWPEVPLCTELSQCIYPAASQHRVPLVFVFAIGQKARMLFVEERMVWQQANIQTRARDVCSQNHSCLETISQDIQQLTQQLSKPIRTRRVKLWLFSCQYSYRCESSFFPRNPDAWKVPPPPGWCSLNINITWRIWMGRQPECQWVEMTFPCWGLVYPFKSVDARQDLKSCPAVAGKGQVCVCKCVGESKYVSKISRWHRVLAAASSQDFSWWDIKAPGLCVCVRKKEMEKGRFVLLLLFFIGRKGKNILWEEIRKGFISGTEHLAQYPTWEA